MDENRNFARAATAICRTVSYENASIAGLPSDYIAEQIAEFRSGSRKSSEPRMSPPAAMIEIAKALPIQTWLAAAYFSSLRLKPWIHVVETSTVPKTHVSGNMLVPDARWSKRTNRRAHHRNPGKYSSNRIAGCSIGIYCIRAAR